MYLFAGSMLRPFCICKTKKMEKMVEVYDKGVAKIEEDFDMVNFA